MLSWDLTYDFFHLEKFLGLCLVCLWKVDIFLHAFHTFCESSDNKLSFKPLRCPWTLLYRYLKTFTWCCLHPATDLVHGGGAEKEEETEAADASDNQHHGHSDEEGGGLERTGGDSGELGEATLACQVSGESVSNAIVKKAEIAGLRRVHAISNPIGLWEDGHVNNTEQDSEDGP